MQKMKTELKDLKVIIMDKIDPHRMNSVPAYDLKDTFSDANDRKDPGECIGVYSRRIKIQHIGWMAIMGLVDTVTLAV